MADRSVTVKLEANVAPFISAMAKAEAAAKKLREGLGRSASIDVRADSTAALASLRAVEREVERLNGSHPTVRPDVDGAQALAELADLHRRFDELNRRRAIGVDLDAGAAKSELSSIQRGLERLNSTSADPKVRLDSAAALAQLRGVQSAMSGVSGKSARVKVDADVGGALAGIATVAAALAGLPSAVSIGVGVAGLGAAFGVAAAGAAGFASVAIPSLGRINEALTQAESASGGAGGAMKSAGQKAAEAAASALQLAEAQDRVADSAQAVKDAQQSVRDAEAGVTRARQDATRAAEEAADRQAQAAARIADAERSVQDAHRATQRAIEDLTRAREAARERIEDLALATERGALSEERARISIRRAEAEMARINNDPKASSLDREDAALRLREAELALREIQERNGDLAKEREESDKKGVEGSDEVVAAKERILDAQRAEADAERALADARAESARVARDGARDVADAQAGIAEAHRKVADAQQAVVKAQRDHLRAVQALKVEQLQQKAALDQVGASSGGAASKMAELSKAERALAKDIQKFKDEYVAWQRSLQPDVFPVIEKGLDVLRAGMDRATPLVRGGAKGLGEFADAAEKALRSPEWTAFFDDIGRRAPDAIAGLGRATINVAGGLRGVVEGFLPYTGPLTAWVEDISQDFEDWGTNLKDSPEFREFLEYAQENGPKVAEILGNIAEFVGKVAQAGAEVGPGLLDFLVNLTDKIANLDPDQIQAVATGIGLIFAAAKLGTTLKLGAFVLLAEVLSEMSPGQIQALAIAIAATITAVKGYQAVSGAAGFFSELAGGFDKAGKSAGGAKANLSSVAGLFGKGGLIGASVAGLAVAFDQVSDALDGLNPDLGELSQHMQAFGKGAEPVGPLLDQVGPKMNHFFGQWETFVDSAARLAGDNPIHAFGESITGFIDANFGIQLDNGKQAIDNLDASLASMVSSGNAQGAAEAFRRLSDQAINAGVPVGKLKDLFPQYASSMDGVAPTTAEIGTAVEILGGQVNGTQQAIGEATRKLNEWKTSLSDFQSQTDAAATIREMEKAFADTEKAIADANGKLELTPGLTAAQRDAVITARDAFAGYLEKIRLSAEAQVTLSGRTTDARDAVLEQLPAMMQLAGSNESARTQVLKLAEAYGISEADAKKAAKGGDDLVEVLAKLKSKDIRVGADTTPAQDAIDSFVRRYNNKSLALAILAKVNARGGISDSHGVELMAAGGMRPAIKSQATLVPGGGKKPDAIFAEAGKEAYIPYDTQYRDRALAILGQVASDFGLSLYGQEATQQVDGMTVAVDSAGLQVSSGLSDAVVALDATLGQAGSLTGSIDRVGVVGEQLVAGWQAGSDMVAGSVASWGEMVSVSVSGMSESMTGSIDYLAESVGYLSESLAAASDAASGGSSRPKSKTAKGSMSKGGQSKASNMVAGHGPTNSSKVSKPQQINLGNRASQAVGGGVPMGGGGATAGSSGPAVVIQEQHIHSEVDANLFAESAAMRVRGRGR